VKEEPMVDGTPRYKFGYGAMAICGRKIACDWPAGGHGTMPMTPWLS